MRTLKSTVAVFAAVLVLAATAGSARAARYEIFINIQNQQDLYDLLASNQISQSTFDTLQELLQRGVDLNQANRQELYQLPNLTYADVDGIIAYRAQAGWISDPTSLVAAGVLSSDKLLAIAPFLILAPRSAGAFTTTGRVRTVARFTTTDSSPASELQAKVSTLKHLTVGVASVLTRNQVTDVRWDPNRRALSADSASATLHLPKAYALWDTPKYTLVLGTYRIGFGQRLTFDTTDQYTPDGIYADDEITRDDYLVRGCKEAQGELAASPCGGALRYAYVTPDFRWSTHMMGAAAGVKAVPAGKGTLQAYAFGSYQPSSAYQYELYDKSICPDPNENNNPNCSAPTVYRRQSNELAPTSRFSYETLPDMYAESTLGGNVTYAFNDRAHIGVTAYHSNIDWLVKGANLDFQEWAPLPYGGPFGAVGADAAWGKDWADVFLEVTRSFDSTPTGGGMGAILRTVGTWGNHEVEASLRYYGTNFNNPHARAISEADKYGGLRARDEIGGRIRYSGKLTKKLDLRTNLDLWESPSDKHFATLAYVRGDVQLNKRLRVGLWSQYENKDLSQSGRGQCFSVTIDQTPEGAPIPCSGEKLETIGRAMVKLNNSWSFDAELQHDLLDDKKFTTRFRQDLSGWLGIIAKPLSTLRFHARVRYLDQAISDNSYLEQSLWSYFDASYEFAPKTQLLLRYDNYLWLDNRMSTSLRDPSPESWFWVELQSRF